MRQLRLRAVWLIVIPFLWFASPTAASLLVGSGLALAGLFVRGWSAGTIHKDQELTVSGPYAFTRNPLYLGSFFIGLGVSIAGGHWIWPVIFLAFFATVYRKTMAGEARHLRELFPERYPEYAARVPGFLPRPTPYRPADGQTAGFRWAQYRRNREWEASLGALAAFIFLTAKAFWF
ncbi:MAG: isoprenylcysteine carboxylmethyltransferase family protein [Longimicrobiales bacterium]|nr:isoprenylcysteine carboxylmethyltransferase family protein [Longimicrobiales bacterium]